MTLNWACKVTLAVCALALLACLALILQATNLHTLRPSDSLIVMYMVGPYAFLALIALSCRRYILPSYIVLGVTLLLVTWGAYMFGVHAYRFQTDEEYRKVQQVGVFVMPLGQWLLAAMLGIALSLWRISR